VGLLAGWLLFGVWGVGGGAPDRGEAADAPPAGAGAAPGRAEASPDEIDGLREQLAWEVGRREALEQELAERSAPAPAEALAPDPSPSPDEPSAAASTRRSEDWIDEALLVAAGFTPAEAEALRRRFEAIELERLFARDQATREGWLRTPRYHQRMQELNAEYGAMRDEHGDERYDWILFASGRQNRVVVERVLRDSAASEVGLEAGDVFLAYDGERVFEPGALQRATSGGVLGETVAVDVLRGGERIRLYPPRGPLGVALRVDRREPEPLY
jgi:hypothetical protein